MVAMPHPVHYLYVSQAVVVDLVETAAAGGQHPNPNAAMVPSGCNPPRITRDQFRPRTVGFGDAIPPDVIPDDASLRATAESFRSPPTARFLTLKLRISP